MIGTGGFPGRFPPDALAVSRYNGFRHQRCVSREYLFSPDKSRLFKVPAGYLHEAGHKPKELSSARRQPQRRAYYGLATEFPEINFLQATVAACDPFLPSASDVEHPNCKQMADFIFGDYLIHHKVDAVVISGRWEENAFPKLQLTLEWLREHGQRVILIGPVTEYDASLPRLLATGLRERNPDLAKEHSMLPILQALDTKLGLLARDNWKVPYISIFEDLCNTPLPAKVPEDRVSGCPLYAAPLVPMLIDTDHLSPQGSLLFATAMRDRNQLP